MRSSKSMTWGQNNVRHTAGRPARRGSALVIVIGTLALIAVFAAIYISVGRSDVRAADTQRVRAQQRDYVDAYASHALEIIGIDRTDATMQYADATLRYQVPRRETTDAPYTDWSVRSESDREANWFFPAGGNPFPRSAAERFDPRVPSDPWLASTRPTYLGSPFSADRPFSDSDINRRFLDDRDWYQITNIAPDGRFVNLFNLRPQPPADDSSGPIGGFNAEPGWGTTNFPGGPTVRRMSQGLTLYEKRNAIDPESAIQALDPIADGFWVPGELNPTDLGMSADEIRNTPAVWSMYQRFALLPADQAFVTYTVNGSNVATWEDYEYPAYQWADADGDGFYDSRWFELTEARSALGSSTQPRDDVQTHYDGGDYRVFAAARIIDLSSMVNVNTARDSLIPPTAEYPLGLTPTEVDLRRLLTMQDAAENYDGDTSGGNNRLEPLALQHTRRPSRERGTGTPFDLLPDADYSRYEHLLIDGQLNLDPGRPGLAGFPTAPNRTQDEFPNAMVVGRYATSAIHRSITLNSILPPTYRGALSIPGALPNDPFHLPEGSVFSRDGETDMEFEELGRRRAEYYRRVGSIDPLRLGEAGVMSLAGNLTNGDMLSDYGMGLFGADDLAELLTFHGLNDPEVMSRLEVAAMGRFQFQGGTGDERYSPLHSTRPLSLDRALHGELFVRPANPNRGTEVTGEIAPESMALLTLSPRSRLTVVSGGAALRPAGVVGNAGRGRNTELTASGLTLSDAAVPLSDIAQSASRAFDAYYFALAGELEVFRRKQNGGVDGLPSAVLNRVWNSDLAAVRDSPYATLFYGHRGPELALRIAAHAAVNAKDLFDTDNETTVATLVLDNGGPIRNAVQRVTGNADFDTKDFRVDTNSEALLYPGLTSRSTIFDLDSDGDDGIVDTAERVLATGILPDDRRKLVNVYGVEPTPIITEVASMYVYTDASENAGGNNDDYGNMPNPPRPGMLPIIDPGDIKQINIDGTMQHDNTDLMMQVFAVQLTNPWDVPIRIGGGSGATMHRKAADSADRFDPSNNLIFDYYLEFNGRFFKLGEFLEHTETLIDFSADSGPIIPADSEIQAVAANAELQYRGVTINPGESRVFYATAHARFDKQHDDHVANFRGMDERWTTLLEHSGGVPDEFTDTGTFDPDGDGIANGRDGWGYTGPAQEWIRRQFTTANNTGGQTARPIRMHTFDPQTGELVYGINTPPVGSFVTDRVFQDYFAPSTAAGAADPAGDLGLTGRTADDTVVRLWKKVADSRFEETVSSQIANNTAGTYQRNLVQNDMLVDRIMIPTGTPLDFAALPAANTSVANSVGFQESFQPVDNACDAGPTEFRIRNDNLGLTLARWVTVRRKEKMDSISTAEANPENGVGQIDAYLISSRRNPDLTTTAKDNSAYTPLDAEEIFNLCGPDPADPFNGVRTANDGITDNAAHDADRTVSDFFRSGWARGRKQIRTIASHPRYKNLTGFAALGPDPEIDRFQADELVQNALVNPRSLFGSGTDTLEPEVFMGVGLNAARVTDALFAMGIGPAYAPDPSRNAVNDMSVYDDEWMTLSEAFAIALGYEDFSASSPNPADLAAGPEPDIVWHDAARLYTDFMGTQQAEFVLDDLRLRLDDYVAFVNAQINTGTETGPMGKPRFDFNFGGSAAGSDARRGTGVPVALGVLDGVRAIDPPRYPGQTSDSPLTDVITGQININTAPVEVLRLLPGLSPSGQGVRTMNGTGTLVREWWAAKSSSFAPEITDGLGYDSGLGLPNLDWTDPFAGAARNPDIAAGLVGYRDRTAVSPRLRSDRNAFPTSYVGELTYAPDIGNLVNQQAIIDNRYAENNGVIDYRTRETLSGIQGVRGTPGFGSLGEMLMASFSEDAMAAEPIVAAHSHMAMNQLGVDTDGGNPINLGVSGMDENASSMSPHFLNESSGFNDSKRAGQVANDYAEQLANAAGVMNIATTRSDYYAVWLVLQGFQESDVATLRPADPLVPSFKKRYLMVVDRSNVIEQGDAPKVILFREVPL